MQSLKNKIAIVAGGTCGAGRGIAVELGAFGATNYRMSLTEQCNCFQAFLLHCSFHPTYKGIYSTVSGVIV